ncbi:Histidine kinase-, DNA gyrase B-, and HSP90-like ATPase [Amycolatopsis xylanica]|uniref:histidine kinase n=1 Tax=Amycolatopsis xylanica TaxID=589385 RepID=A0A1H3PEQ0_9PSEU|nr:ATP-binding protein [Amycolatopsis xylanica]SDY99642.1 Histidine kinase-, DNA gyrase B-, and HSP90-like ATPase [Amycolatopsis xylanica]
MWHYALWGLAGAAVGAAVPIVVVKRRREPEPDKTGPDKTQVSQALLTFSTEMSQRIGPLIDRQLAIIDRLEQTEEDPDRLAKLFELDQMATLMRRNQERLLLLAGAPYPRQVDRPAPLEDVLGAAVSAVEEYTRVEVHQVIGFAVVGDAVFDLVHLITELLANATSFSPPDTKVILRVKATDEGDLKVEIADAGLGLDEPELGKANSRLVTPHEIDLGAGTHLGLDVVALVSRRQGITVSLRGNDDDGLTAEFTVPAALLKDERAEG